MTRYLVGSKGLAMRYMAECAIRDREAMIDAVTPPRWVPISPEAQAVIEDCRNAIADFKRLAGITAPAAGEKPHA